MSGLELCSELRAGFSNHDLHVMTLTMCEEQKYAACCHEAGADAYVLKSEPRVESDNG